MLTRQIKNRITGMSSSPSFSPKLAILFVFFALLFFVAKLSKAPAEPRMPGVVAAPAIVLPRSTKPMPEMQEIPQSEVLAPAEEEPSEESWD